MANDVTSGNSTYKYDWNPFQDILANNITQELITVKDETTDGYQPILIPRCAPFFADKVKIFVKSSGRELSFENGDYSFVYPYMTFLKTYQNLVYGGILLHNQVKDTNYLIDYSTIGGDYVLDEINYAQLIANINVNERTANWEQIVNLPDEFPADPHDHPVKDTAGYLDLIVWMKSYLDALVGIDTSLTLAKQFADHLQKKIDKAHGGGLEELNVLNLKDYPLADEKTIATESTQIYANIWAVKKLIRSFYNNEWS